MIKLEPHEVCPHEDSCGHRDDFVGLALIQCEGINPDRDCDFLCAFFVEAHSSSENRPRHTLETERIVKSVHR